MSFLRDVAAQRYKHPQHTAEMSPTLTQDPDSKMAKSCRCDTPDSGANVADPEPDVCHTCRGDSSDEMSFIAFFPPVLRPFAQILSTSAYKIACGKAVRALLDDLPTGEETLRTSPYTLDPNFASR